MGRDKEEWIGKEQGMLRVTTRNNVIYCIDGDNNEEQLDLLQIVKRFCMRLFYKKLNILFIKN